MQTKQRSFTLAPLTLALALALASPLAHADTAGGTVSGSGNVTTQDTSGNLASGAGALAAVQTNNTAIGQQAQANEGAATAVGAGSLANQSSTAFGAAATGQGIGSVAVGAGAQGLQGSSVAVGSNSVASVAGVAIGAGASVPIAPGGAGTAGVALGYQATSAGIGSVALGAGSTDLGLAGVVSVGTTSQQRRIINLAPGQAATDAVNLGQLDAAALAGYNYTNTQTAGAVTTANSYTNQQITTLQNLINQATASGLCKYNGAGGIVCGHNTTAAAGAVAQGNGASAGYAGSLAIGQGATITAPTNPADPNTTGAIAIGNGAQANADPATAIGFQADAAGANSVALGYAATAVGTNSVALGAGSVANRPNSVSVGSAGQQRQITNVAPGTSPTDAVNLGQLQQATAGLLGQADTFAAQGIAMAAALNISPIYGPDGYSLSAGVGSYGGQSAVGIAFSRRTAYHQYPVAWTVGVGFNGGSGAAVGKVGASIGW
ncbi:MAG: YadA family autotransporter adhesin [Thiomonas sp.]